MSLGLFCGLRRSRHLYDLIREAVISVAQFPDEPGFWLDAIKVCVVSLTSVPGKEYGLHSVCELRVCAVC